MNAWREFRVFGFTEICLGISKRLWCRIIIEFCGIASFIRGNDRRSLAILKFKLQGAKDIGQLAS
jgi:hypothetical protein